MKRIKSLFIVIVLLFSGLAFGQKASKKEQHQSVIIEYRAEIQERYVDSFVAALNNKKDVTMAVKQQVAYNYMNADPESFTLKINGKESYYSQNKTLNLDGEYNMGSNAPDHDFYCNMELDLIVEHNPYFGKIKRNPMEWTIVSTSSRNIGGYTCYKAIANQRLYSRQGFYYNRDVIAWFTPEIPLPYGPANYNGLPGIVLEIARDEFIITATKILLNPNETIKITRVDEDDKMITEEESHRRIGAITKERKSEGN